MRIPDELLDTLANEYLFQTDRVIPFFKYLELNKKVIQDYKEKKKRTIQ